jgi:hypothetical protein
MVSPVVSPVSSPAGAPAASGLTAAPAAPPLTLPPTEHVPEAHNPQGPALAQGRGLQQRLQELQRHKNSAYSDAELWLAQARTHDPELAGNQKLEDDYFVTCAIIKNFIKRDNRTLSLTNSEVSHLPESVLQYFDGFDFSGLSRISSLKIPRPAAAPGIPQDTARHRGKVHVSRCPALMKLSVADGCHTSISVQTSRSSGENYYTQTAQVFVSACDRLEQIDLSQTVAVEVILSGDHMVPNWILPAELSTLRGKVDAGFDPQGAIFLTMLRNCIRQLASKDTAASTDPNGNVAVQPEALIGLVKLAQVSLAMQQCAAQFTAAAQKDHIATPCLQQACFQELFGPVLRQHLSETTWLADYGVLPISEQHVVIPPELKLALRNVAKEVAHQGIVPLLDTFPLLAQSFANEYPPTAMIEPGTLAKICIKGLVAEGGYLDEMVQNAVANAALHTSLRSALIPASDPPVFAAVSAETESLLSRQLHVQFKPSTTSYGAAYLRVSGVLGSHFTAVDMRCSPGQLANTLEPSTVFYDVEAVATTPIKPQAHLQPLPPGITRVVLLGQPTANSHRDLVLYRLA